MPGPYMPTIKVEIAFNAGFTTPEASRTWTDVSAYVEGAAGLGIDYGRTDEISTADANQLTVVFDNTDGRFTWGNASGAYFPNVKLNRPIRVTVDTPSNAGKRRVVAFINEWPVEWPSGSGQRSTATVTASSRLSRLGLTAAMKSVLEHTILGNDPVGYWVCNEAAGATAANDSAAAGASPLEKIADTVTFGSGTGPGTDGYTAMTLNGGVVRATHAAITSTGAAIPQNPVVLTFYVRVDPAAEAGCRILRWLGPDGHSVELFQDGSVVITPTVGTITLTPGAIADNSTHLVTIAVWSVDLTGVLTVGALVSIDDGALSDTDSLGGQPSNLFTVDSLRIGSGGFKGTLSHIAAFTPSGVAAVVVPALEGDVYEAGSTGFAGDTTDERLLRYTGWAGIPAAEVVTTASPITLGHIDSTGAQLVELLRKVETSEAGVLHDDRDGKLRLRTRSSRYNVSPTVTLDAAAQMVGLDYSPKVDRSALVNIGDGTNTAGTVTARYIDQTSRDDHGDATVAVETAAQDDDEPLALAAWLVNAYSEPNPRAPTVTVDMLRFITDSTDDTLALLDLDIGSKIRLTNLPAQAPATTADYFVEGYNEQLGHGVWTLTLNLSPTQLWDDVLILDSATDGLLDTNVLAL